MREILNRDVEVNVVIPIINPGIDTAVACRSGRQGRVESQFKKKVEVVATSVGGVSISGDQVAYGK